MTEQAPVTIYVLDARLPWPDEPGGMAERGPLERGAILDPNGRSECAIRKIAAKGATLRADLNAGAGTALAIELGIGQRRSGVVEWSRGGELGVRFDEPLDMVALINRNLVSQPAERRRMPRLELRCLAHVKWCENLVPATTRNISSQGIQLEGDALPEVGTLVSLFVEGINLPSAEVVWRQGQLAGFEFFDEVHWSSIIAWVREMGRRPGQAG